MSLKQLTLLLCTLCVLPIVAFAYTSVIVNPETGSTVLQIKEPGVTQEFFGKLDGFPHTFQFYIGDPIPFSSTIFVHAGALQKNDVSLILVKEEKRGVSEVGRTRIQEDEWKSVRHFLYAESFKQGGKLEFELQEGVYMLEVSAPNNDGEYRLVLGTEKIKRGYFENLQALFEIKRVYGSSLWTVFLSPLVYVPLLALLALFFIFYHHRKRR